MAHSAGKAEDALKRCDTVYTCPKEELMNEYARWAKDYNRDLGHLGYQVPSQVSQVLLKYSNPNGTIIDIACGTGLVAESLKNHGFTGTLHGLDGSQEMIDVAKEKNVYDDLYVEFLTPGKPISVAPHVKYDGLTCAGSITKNHLDPLLVKEFVDLLQPNGVASLAVRDSAFNKEVLKRLHNVLNELEKSKRILKLEVKSFADQWFKDGDETDAGSTRVFCYRKLH